MFIVDISMDLHNHKSSAVRKHSLPQTRSILALLFIINCSGRALANFTANMSIKPVIISSSVKQTATVSIFSLISVCCYGFIMWLRPEPNKKLGTYLLITFLQLCYWRYLCFCHRVYLGIVYKKYIPLTIFGFYTPLFRKKSFFFWKFTFVMIAKYVWYYYYIICIL